MSDLSAIVRRATSAVRRSSRLAARVRSPSSCAATPSTACTTARSPSSIATGACCMPPAIPTSLTFTRSALKPLQALPFVAAGGVERFGFTQRAGRAAVREPFRRAAARRRPRPTCSRKAGNTVGRPAVRHACAALSTTCAARSRRRRRIRRSRTTAPASTAGCSRYCVALRLPQATTTSRSTIRCSRRSARAVAHFTGVAGGRARRRHRRLLRAELRGAARAARARASPGSPPPTTTRVYGRAPRDAGRRDDRAPGNGVGRAAQRPRAHARRPRRLGGKIGAEGVQAIGVRSRGIGHRDQGRRRQQARPVSGRPWRRARAARAARRRGARADLAHVARAGRCATTGASSPGSVRAVVVLDKADRPLTPASTRDNPAAEMNLPVSRHGLLRASARRGRSDEAAQVRGLELDAGCRTRRSAGITTNDSGTTRGWVIAKSISSSSSVRSGATSARSSCWS